MNSAILVIARQELRSARTNQMAMLLLAIFIGMVLLSGFIGWQTHHTVNSVYQEARREGATTAPDPFAAQQPLELIKNTIIYVILIGALAAILLGVRSTVADRKAGVIDLLFSRPITTGQYVAGKLLGIQFLTGFILVVTAMMSWIVVWLIRGQALSLPDTTKLVQFSVLAWLFLFPFSTMGFISGAISRRETSALLVPILLWALMVFVIPQLGTAEHPVSLLNPVPAQTVSQGPFFTFNRDVLQPVSVTERFKNAGSGSLQLNESTGQSHLYDWSSLAVVALLSGGAALLATRRETMRRPFYE